jgi:hypothetical protein
MGSMILKSSGYVLGLMVRVRAMRGRSDRRNRRNIVTFMVCELNRAADREIDEEYE